MIAKQTCPFFFIIEYDVDSSPADPTWLAALTSNLKTILVNCTDKRIMVLENKVPKRMLRKTVYNETFGLLQYNRSADYPYYDLVPRSNSFEITIRGEVVWSRLATNEYPTVDYIRQRVQKIVSGEGSEEFMRLAQANNMCQFIEQVRVPEPEKKLKDMVSPKLYAEYKRLQMQHNLRKSLQQRINEKRKDMVKEQRDRIIKQFVNGINQKVQQQKEHFQKIQQQKEQILELLSISLKAKIDIELQKLDEKERNKNKLLKNLADGFRLQIDLNKQKKEQIARDKAALLERIRVNIQKRIDAERYQMDKVYRQKLKMLELLKQYFRSEIEMALEILKFNEENDPKKKYGGMSMEEMVKVMTVEEMLMMGDEIPSELFMEKLKSVKVTYLGPTTNLVNPENQFLDPKSQYQSGLINAPKQFNDSNMFLNKYNTQEMLSQTSEDNILQKKQDQDNFEILSDSPRLSPQKLKTNPKQLKARSALKIRKNPKKFFIDSKNTDNFLSPPNGQNIQSDQNLKSQDSTKDGSRLGNQQISQKNIMFYSALKAGILSKIRPQSKAMLVNDNDSDSSDEEENLENKEYFDLLNALTKHAWMYKLPNNDVMELDDTECVLVNQQRNLINMELFKYKMMKYKANLSTDKDDTTCKQMFAVTMKFHCNVSRYRFIKPNPSSTIDLVTKNLFYTDKETKQKLTLAYDYEFNGNDAKSKIGKQQDNFKPITQSLEYQFTNWGWLGNEYLKRNDYRMPSWKRIKACLIQEQIIMLKEEELQNQSKKGILTKLELNPELISLMATKIQFWQDLFNHIELPIEEDKPIPDREFKNPKSKTIKAIFYLYSLDSFLYSRLNWAARARRSKCIKNLGGFAAILSRALSEASRYREDHVETEYNKLIVYRGLGLTPQQLSVYKEGQLINISGFASTSQNYFESLKFACHKDMNPACKSVMFCIELTEGTEGGFSFQMNDRCYTKYVEEEEILLDDGRPFVIDKVTHDYIVQEKPYRGRKITRIQFKSCLPKGLMPNQPGRLHTQCNLREFLQNGNKMFDDRKDQYLCFFQTESQDMTCNSCFSNIKSDLTMNSYVGGKNGYKAGISSDVEDADALYFEKFARIPGREDAGQFLGLNSFRIYTDRFYQGTKDHKSRKPIRRYLSLNPSQNQPSLSLFSDYHMIASFEPDEFKANIWQFELLKTDSKYANYIIVNRVWMWDRIDKSSTEGWISFEKCSYLAIRSVDNKSNQQHLKKSNNQSYIYVTRDRNEAAVWQWSLFPDIENHDKIEINVPVDTQTFCRDQWIYRQTLQGFTSKNVTTFPVLTFNADNTFILQQKYQNKCLLTSCKTPVNQNFNKQPTAPIEKVTEGTWCFLSLNQVRFIQLKFVDEADMNSQRGTVLLEIDSQNNSILLCRKSTSYRIVDGFKIISSTDEDYVEKLALSKCHIYKDEASRRRLLDLLPDGVKLKDYIYCSQNQEEDPKADSNSDFIKQFQDACIGKMTLILVRGDHDRTFGAYTEIMWTKNVSAPKQSNVHNSFIFGQNIDRRTAHDDQFYFKKYKVGRNKNETFHSDEFAANFYDLKFLGPNEPSEIRPNDSHYHLPASLVTDEPMRLQKNIDGVIKFKYKMMEVFSLSTSSAIRIRQPSSEMRRAMFMKKQPFSQLLIGPQYSNILSQNLQFGIQNGSRSFNETAPIQESQHEL